MTELVKFLGRRAFFMNCFNDGSVIQDYYFFQKRDFQHTYLIQLPQSVEVKDLMYALVQVVHYQPMLRTSYTSAHEHITYCEHQFSPFIEVIDNDVATTDIDLNQYVASQIPTISPTEYPLFQFIIFRFTDAIQLCFTVSPIIFDAISMPSFLKQLNHCYCFPFQSMSMTSDFTQMIRQENIFRQSNVFQQQLKRYSMYQSLLQETHQYMPVRRHTSKTQSEGLTISLAYDNLTRDDIYNSIVLANHIMSRSEQVVLGVTTEHYKEETKVAIGPRLGLLPIQFDVHRHDTYRTLREQVATRFSEVEQMTPIHLKDVLTDVKEVPFETVIHLESVVFDFEFDYQQCTATLMHPNVTDADIDIYLYKSLEGYDIKMMYNREQFDDLTVNTYANLIQTLCQQGIERPDISMKEMSLMTTAQDEALLEALQQVDTLPHCTVPELFEEQVQSALTRTALRYGETSLTYEALDRQTNQMARQLRQMGIKPNDYVAVIAERSIEMIASIIGIVKSGAAYVPIDPDAPQSRITYILEDCEPSLIVVHGVTVTSPIQTIDIATLMTGDASPLPIVNTPDDDLYVIYTSGTTGQPKGTRIAHRSVDRLVKHIDYVPLNQTTKILLSGTIAFDAVTFEIYGALLNGGELIVISKERLIDPKLLGSTIKQYKINTLLLTTSLFNQIVSEHVEALEPLDYMIIGGEVIKHKWVDILNQRPNHPQIINAYGPTESTTITTAYAVPETLPSRIPIGKPIRQTAVYIMQNEQQCGVGVPGELCIGGSGVAKGYLNRPDLTEKQFMKHPLTYERIYRSGDLVRLQPDGNIDYLGRLDHQVKIRGFRIELSEIERAIERINGVNKAVVIVTMIEEDKQLHAYYEGPEPISKQTLKEALRAQLPSYMIPLHFKHITQIPTTANGKLDQRALPKIEAVDEAHFVAPTNQVEAVLCHIFEEVLHIERVGITDHFFELGGHSLKATLVMNRIEQLLNKSIKVRDILKMPTVQQLATVLMSLDEKNLEAIPVVSSDQSYFPVSTVQRGMYLVWRLNPKEVVYNVPFLWRLSAPLDVNRLREAIQMLIQRHEILRTQFKVIDQTLYQVIHDTLEPDFEVIRQTVTTEQQLIESLTKPFNLERDALIRVRYVETTECDYVFMDTHHSINDGMSQTIILNELNQLYQNKPLPPVVHQYKDYSEWMNKRNMTVHQNYWKNIFQDGVPMLDLPLDNPRPSVKTVNGDMVYYPLSEALTTKIKSYVKEHDVTDFMFFMSVVMVMLSKYSGQEDIVMGSVMSARTHPDTEKMLGMFANSVVFRGKPQAHKKWLTFLSEIKAMSLSAYDHQDYPFIDLVDDLITDRDAARHPFFDVMLVRQNNEENHAHFGHSQLTHVVPKSTTAKFDMSFIIEESENHYVFNVEYSTDIFNEETIYWMCQQLDYMMQVIVEEEDLEIAKIPTALPSMTKWIESHVQRKTLDAPDSETIASLFEAQVKLYQKCPLLIHKGEVHTYHEVFRHSCAIAQYLYEKGLRRGDHVAIMTQRGHGMIEAMLGAAMLGCPYVPIDPSYPKKRIEFILDDADIKHVLVSGAISLTKPTTCLSDIPMKTKRDMSFEMENEVTPYDTLYIIYTSGTTGQPKGVEVTHRNVIHLIKSWQELIQLQSDDVILQYENIVFDASVWEIYTSILNAVPLVIASKEERLDIRDLEQVIATQNVTVASIPVQVCMLLESYQMRCLVTGGSVSTPALLHRVMPHVEMYVNAYGPTEATVIATAKVYEAQPNSARVPIGRPLQHTQVYMMAEGQLCGVGVPGELCISGDGVAKGYWQRPELNQKAFIKNPFGEGQLYRTGDMARYLPNGDIEYIGRRDHQQKFNGYRIELDEITNAMNQIEGIKDSAVMIDQSGNEARLIAYYVALDHQEQRIRSILSDMLPQYMIPQRLIHLDRLPLTANGKLDKDALPSIDSSTRQVISPRTEQESQLMNVFERVLGLSPISIDDDFFEIGGTSLAAMKVVTIMRELGHDMTLQDIYQYKTVRAILAHHTNIAIDVPGNIDLLHQQIQHNHLPLPQLNQQSLGTILLTGATGFLGAYLLFELKESDSMIYCVVRGQDSLQAKQRLISHLEYYFEDSVVAQIMRHVKIILGDFNQSFSDYEGKINTVIHAGALTDHFGDNEEFYKVNVLSTQNLVNFAIKSKAKLIYISTMSVGSSFLEAVEDKTFAETDVYKGQYIASPYTQSKLYGEFAVLEGMKEGLNAKIMRIGNLTSAKNGKVAMKNMSTNRFSIVMHTLSQLDAIGDSMAHTPISFSFVDEAAQTVIRIAQTMQRELNVFHVTSEYQHTFLEVLERATGRSFEVIDDEAFESMIYRQQLYTLVGLNEGHELERPAIMSQKFTHEMMTSLEMSWSDITSEWLGKWYQLMIQTFE